jgi:hypothetical protein
VLALAAILPVTLLALDRSALVLCQEDQKFCWFGVTRIPADNMNIFGAFIEGLSCDSLSANTGNNRGSCSQN